MSKTKLLLSVLTIAAAAAGFAAALFGNSGCGSTCAQNCPATTVYIGSNDNHELNGILTNLDVMGPACPPSYGLGCSGDGTTTICTNVTITAQHPGACDVLLVFSDRPSEIVHLKFGETVNANGSCCRGYPVIGPSVYTIPDKPTGPIYSGGFDGGPIDTDAVTVLTDAGTTTTKPDAARDAGADSLLLPDAQ
jgi:hypothetical protein